MHSHGSHRSVKSPAPPASTCSPCNSRKLAFRCHLLTLSTELSRDECRFLVSAARAEGTDTLFALITQGVSEAIISDDCLLEPFLHCRGDAGDRRGHRGFFTASGTPPGTFFRSAGTVNAGPMSAMPQSSAWWITFRRSGYWYQRDRDRCPGKACRLCY